MIVNEKLNGVFQAVRKAAGKAREHSESGPAGMYVEGEFAEFEAEEIFGKEWISVCHTSQLENAGDYVHVDVGGEPMLITRGKDGVVRALSRVCRHRGMDVMPLTDGDAREGNQRMVLCPYHLWSYDLTGQLCGVPEMREAAGFDRSDVALHEFRMEIWEGFVFVNLGDDQRTVAERYGRLKDDFLGKWDMGAAKVVWAQHWECDFNWKILLENFMEAYHHLGAHIKTLEPFLPAKGCWTEPYDPEFSAMHLPLKQSMQDEIELRGEADTAFQVFPGLEGRDLKEWGIYLGYPNFLLFTAPDRVYWYRLLPTGPETSSLMTTMLVADRARDVADYEEVRKKEIAGGIEFHMEDMAVCEATQRGVRSKVYKPGRLSHLEEPIWHFQRYLAGVIERAGKGGSKAV